MTSDAVAFHDFEQQGWERASAHYADAFGNLTSQMAGPLLDATRVRQGIRLLDVCTGPGFIAAAAAARGGAATGLDFSAAMIAEAKRRHPDVDFREGDAEALPFPIAAFEAVVMNFGLLHLARPDAAIAEAHRVLRGGGRYALTVWSEDAVGFGLALKAIQQHGNPNVPLPDGPPFFRFSAAAELERTLHDAGFSEVAVQTVPLTWRVKSTEEVFGALSKGGVRTAAILRAQTPDALAAIADSIRQGVEAYGRAGQYEIPMPAVLASATKPEA